MKKHKKGLTPVFRLFCLALLSTNALAQEGDGLPEQEPFVENTAYVKSAAAPNIDVKSCRLSNYQLNFNVMDGKKKAGSAQRSLKRTGNEVQLYTKVQASVAFMTFVQSEKSTLAEYGSKGLQSVQYAKTRKKPFKKAKTTSYQLNSDFDPLSVYDHLRELVCSGLNSNIVLNVQDESSINEYQFSYHGIHQLKLPIGLVDAVLLKRTRATSTRETSVWFDINNHYLPVQIQQDKEGETQVLLVAKSISVNT